MATSLRKIFRAYCSLGWHLFPVRPITKRPAIKDNLNSASNDVEQLMKWAKQFPGCNWGISLAKSGLVAVDVDVKHAGLEAWETLVEEHGEPENAVIAQSGNGGKHYVFRADKSQRYRGKIQKGIDIKYNGYVLVYPSVHESSGKQYQWADFKKHVRGIGDYPKWIANLIHKDTRTGKHDPTYRFGSKYLEKLVKNLKEYELDYDEWYQAGMALHAATDGSNEGLQLYFELTQGKSFQEGDLEKAEGKWESFSNKTDGISGLTLGYLIRKKGGIVPSPTYEDDIRKFKEIQIASYEDKVEDAEYKGFIEEDEVFVCYSRKVLIRELNEMGFAFLKTGGKTPFMRVTNKGAVREVTTMGEHAFRSLMAPYFFAQLKIMATDTKIVHVPAYKVWMESIRRREYDRIVFKETAEEGELNLWTGKIGMVPSFDEEPTLILDFIKKSLCSKDELKFNWVLDWLAHIVQKPFERSTVVPVFISKQGAGKGLLMDDIMGKILGEYYTAVSTAEELMTKFNLKLTKKFLTFIDEATWRGNKTEDGILKRLTASPTMTVEEKFGATYDMENFSRYCIASNNLEAVALEVGNRRYVVIEADNKYANDLEYFGPIAEKVKTETYRRMFLGYLLKRDISGFNPYAILENNTAGSLAKINTEGPVAMFWDDVLTQNPQKLWLSSGHLVQKLAFEAFQNYCSEIKTYEKSISARAFWAKTKKVMANFKAKPYNRKLNGEAHKMFSYTFLEMQNDFCETMTVEKPEFVPEKSAYTVQEFEPEDEYDF